LQWSLANAPTIKSLAEVNNRLEERLALIPKPVDFDDYVEAMKRVSSTCLVNFERNRYSVRASFANRSLSRHSYPDKIEMIAEGALITQLAQIVN